MSEPDRPSVARISKNQFCTSLLPCSLEIGRRCAPAHRPVGRSMSMHLRTLGYLQRRLGETLPLRVVLWDGKAFDFSPAPAITITLGSRRLLRSLMAGNFARLGDAYVSGELAVDGRVEDIVRVGIELAKRIGATPLLSRLTRALAYLPARHNRRRDAAAIRHHYDVSNEFYRLWLDRNLIYSCAYFRTGTENLDAAQEQKLEHICRKLLLRPGERLLDIGCGWGGLLAWAARNHGVEGVGVTLSERQFLLARQRIAEAGLAGQIEIRLQDYRDIAGRDLFEKIVSVGMYEHVGLANFPRYFSTIFRLLKPGGAFLNHGITRPHAGGHAKSVPGGEFIERHVFPGGELPSLARVAGDMTAIGLEITDIEDLRPHYALTLKHWVRRLEASAAEATLAASPEHYRIWRIYMAAMAFAFDRGWLSIAQVLALKPHAESMAKRPWTRDHQYDGNERPPSAGSLEW